MCCDDGCCGETQPTAPPPTMLPPGAMLHRITKPPSGPMGIYFKEGVPLYDPTLRIKNLVVEAPGPIGVQAGLFPGDRVVQVNGIFVSYSSTVQGLINLLTSLPAGHPFDMCACQPALDLAIAGSQTLSSASLHLPCTLANPRGRRIDPRLRRRSPRAQPPARARGRTAGGGRDGRARFPSADGRPECTGRTGHPTLRQQFLYQLRHRPPTWVQVLSELWHGIVISGLR